MKNISLKTIILSILSLFAIHCNAEQYELVTNEGQLVAGDKYVIACFNELGAIKVMKEYISGDNCSVIDNSTYINNELTSSGYAILSLGGQTGEWNFSVGEHYYTATNKTGRFKLTTGTALTDYCKFTISFNGNKAIIKCPSQSSSNSLLFNETNFAFRADNAADCFQISLLRQIKSYQRTVTPNKLSTICLENGVDDTSTSGAKFYSIIGVKGTEGNRTIYFGEVTGALTAGQPYLFIPSRTTLSLTKNATATAVAGSHNGLTGTFTEITGDPLVGKYIANNNTIRKCGTGCTVGANRAYIDMKSVPNLDAVPSNEAEAKGILEFGIQEDDVTGIISLDNLINKSRNTKVFNTSGQQISNSTHGIVIINGKKHLR